MSSDEAGGGTRAGGARFNPWPYGIMAFFAVAISATAWLIVLACREPNQLVAADYYDQEIRYQSRVDQEARTRMWESKISATHLPEPGVVVVQLPSEHAATATGFIDIYRPSAAGSDRRIVLALDANGRQAVPAREWTPGLWKVRLQWKVGGENFYAERKVVLPAGG